MVNSPQIAVPAGLFKAGLSGAGGDITPLTRIRRDIFQLTNMIYGLHMTGSYKGLDPKSIIIDIEYDGYTMHDPHSARPMSFVTDDPDQQDRGTWYGTFKAPNAGQKFSAVGRHKVKVSVAPRQAPLTQMVSTIVVPKDGATKTVTTTVTTRVPVYGTSCTGLPIITGYEDKYETSTMEVPMKTEISYEGYSVRQVLGPRDFSPESGGVSNEFEFEIFPSNLPPYDLPTED